MFIATRITNGIVAVLALLTSIMLYFGGGGLAMIPAAIQLALVALFFVCDVIFRKKVAKSDILFTSLWTLLFSLAFFEGTMRFSTMFTEPKYAEPLGGPVVVGLMLILIYGVPLFLNSIYLVRLLKQKKIQAQ